MLMVDYSEEAHGKRSPRYYLLGYHTIKAFIIKFSFKLEVDLQNLKEIELIAKGLAHPFS